MLLKVFLPIVVVLAFAHLVLGAADKILCYYASWGANRPGDGRFTAEDIDANLCTHVNYAFLGLNEDGSFLILDEATDIDQGGLAKVIWAGTRRVQLHSQQWQQIKQKGQQWPKVPLTLCRPTFDGIDVDWEYPLEADRENYITLLRKLKEAFKPHGYLLTVAVAAIPTDAAYDVPAMSEILDVINVMTYDFHGSWAGITAQNSPLYASPLDGEWQRDNLNANSSITHWILEGADPQKLAIGVAFYGHAFLLSDASQHDLGAPSNGPAPPGEFTNNMGTLGYNELCEFHQNGEIVWDDVQKVPYMYDGTLWVGFDNPESVGLKAQYAKENNLAGVMIWSVETDDLHGFCGTKNALLQAINDNIN